MNLSEQDKETGRIEAFSDGVFAIVITLLIFDIKAPAVEQVDATNLLIELGKQWPTYLAFVASFFFILVMWINHHRLFTAIRRSDNTLLLLNGLLLFGVTLVPFPTSIVARYLQHRDQVMAVLVYNGLFFIIALFFNGLWMYASHHNRLFNAKTDPHLVKFISRQYAFGPVLYLLAFLVAFVSPVISLVINVGLAVFFALPNRAVQALIDEQTELPT